MKKLQSTPPNFILIIICIGLMSINLQAQTNSNTNGYTFWNTEMQAIAKPESQPGWVYFKDNFTTPVQNIFTTHASAFGLGSNDEMVLVREGLYKDGYKYYSFQQFHDGMKVYNGAVVITEKNGVLKTISGNIASNLSISYASIQNSSIVLSSYLNQLDVEDYYWNNVQFENQLKITENNPNATYYPTVDTVIYEGRVSYSFDVYCLDSVQKPFKVIIDAVNQHELYRESIYKTCVNGTGCTWDVNSDDNITTTQLASNNFQLSFQCNGTNGTSFSGETKVNNNFNILNSALNAGISQFDSDNIWDINCGAHQAHKSMHNFFDMLNILYERSGYDNNGSMAIQHVNMDASGAIILVPDVWAAWMGGNETILSGIGTNGNVTFFTGTSDIVGHEWMHAVTAHSGNGLAYYYESGAINESVSDIFGVANEFIEEGIFSGNFDWTIGEDIMPNEFTTIRDLSDPSFIGLNSGPGPNTYLGTHWVHTSSDNYGVHSNSKLMNYWFYLLTSGGSGTNEHCYNYSVSQIPFLDALKIVYYALPNIGYTGTYLKARKATVDYAVNEFGLNSNEHIQVMNAWDAVGVYDIDIYTAYPTLTYTNNVTWNNNIVVSGEITITDGNTLTIQDATILFGSQGKITVEPGATLNIINSTLSNYQYPNANCAKPWKGIKVLSDPNQNIVAGHVNLINNSTIEKAEIAIQSFYMYQASATSAVWLKPGGSINAQNSTIKNCNIGIVLGEGTYSLNENYLQNTVINDVLFQKTQLLSPLSNSVDIMIDLEENNSVGILGMGFGYNNQYDIDITACQFKNILSSSNPHHKGIGILTNQTFASINNNEFSKLSKGIELHYSNVNNNNHVTANTFNRVDKGLTIIGKCPLVEGNIFNQIPPGINTISGMQVYVEDTYGIRYLGTGYQAEGIIQNNTLKGVYTFSPFSFSNSYGIVIEDAWNTAEPLYVYNNTFEGVDIGIQSQLNNDALKIKCNTFAANGSPHNIAGIAVFDQQADMGEKCSGNSTYQAGNEWLDYCNGSTQKDIAIDVAAGSFTYWAHNYATGDNPSHSSTQPLCSNTGLYTLKVCDGVSYDNSVFPPLLLDNRIKDNTSCVGALVGWLKPGNTTWNTFIAELVSDRDAIATHIINLQAQLTNPDTEKELVSKIESGLAKLGEYNGKIAGALKDSGDEQAYKQFLESVESSEAKMELAQYYMEKGNYAAAQSLLSGIELLSPPDYVFETAEEKTRYELNATALSQINAIEIALKNNGRTWLQLNEAEKEELRTIKNGFTPAAKTAEQILQLYGEAPNPHPIKKFTEEYLLALESNKNTFNYQFSLAPNPADVQTTAGYTLPEWTKTAQLKVMDQYNQMGVELIDVDIEKHSTSYTINTSTLQNGIYLVYLMVNDEVVAGDQLLVIH